MTSIPGGIYELGFSGKGFSYDNELPEHNVFLYPFKIDTTPVSNEDFMRFIDDGGYQNTGIGCLMDGILFKNLIGNVPFTGLKGRGLDEKGFLE
jgi:formylglycine-generating enzyme required for sulfatase activity